MPPVAGFVRCYVAACAGCAIADRIGPDLGIVMIVNQPDPENENDEGCHTPLAYSTRSYYGFDYD